MSNFPLWIFDKEYMLQSAGKPGIPIVPTIGFNLVGRHDQVIREIYGPLSMFQALFATMMEAHDERYIERHNRFRTIKIPTLGVRTTDFQITPERSERLYKAGLKAGREFFKAWSPSVYISEFSQLIKRTESRT